MGLLNHGHDAISHNCMKSKGILDRLPHDDNVMQPHKELPTSPTSNCRVPNWVCKISKFAPKTSLGQASLALE
eukprot:5369100-Amphidinium_carterae.1